MLIRAASILNYDDLDGEYVTDLVDIEIKKGEHLYFFEDPVIKRYRGVCVKDYTTVKNLLDKLESRPIKIKDPSKAKELTSTLAILNGERIYNSISNLVKIIKENKKFIDSLN